MGPRPEQRDRDGSFGDVDQADGYRIAPAEHPIDVGGAEIPAAVLPQVESAAELGGDVTGRSGAEEIGGREPEDGAHRGPCLRRRNLMLSGAPVKAHASRKPLTR